MKKITKDYLRIEIECRFKSGLSDRFDPKYVISNLINGKSIINNPCILCREYDKETSLEISACDLCPFNKYSNDKNVLGCSRWLRLVMKRIGINNFLKIISITDKVYIEWDYKNQKKAIEYLKLLRKEAKELITWI